MLEREGILKLLFMISLKMHISFLGEKLVLDFYFHFSVPQELHVLTGTPSKSFKCQSQRFGMIRYNPFASPAGVFFE